MTIYRAILRCSNGEVGPNDIVSLQKKQIEQLILQPNVAAMTSHENTL